MPRPGLFTAGNEPVPIEWAPWPLWTGKENLTYNGTRYPDRPAGSDSPYQLRYPGPPNIYFKINFNIILPPTPKPLEVTFLFFSYKHLLLLSPILRALLSHLLYACYIPSNSIVLDLCHIADSEN
jgi:hypothetical protein